jgi:hypothetical protein
MKPIDIIANGDFGSKPIKSVKLPRWQTEKQLVAATEKGATVQRAHPFDPAPSPPRGRHR